MENIVISRPKSFNYLEEAVEYCIKNNIVQNIHSARVSIPTLFTKMNNNRFYWKVDLLLSKKYWAGWFEGLTKSFLSVKIPKLLVMAGPERMDKELTIAHMQGKFKLVNIPDTGHFIHEDNYKGFSETAKTFIKIFKIGEELIFK